jgi:hypothetical protein
MRTVVVGQTGVLSYFDIKLLDGTTPALNEAGGQPLLSVNGAPFDVNGIGPLVAIGFGKYTATINPAYFALVGDIIQTAYSSGTAAVAYGDSFQVGGQPSSQATSLLYYGSVADGDLYFSARLRSGAWIDADPSDKLKAIREATMLIDRLNFAGDKVDSNQRLEFPRMNNLIRQATTKDGELGTIDTFVIVPSIDVQVPNDIIQACYNIALKLLEGYDPDIEKDNLTMTENKYSQVGSKFDRTFIPEYLNAGIPSATAWSLLRPYLRDPRSVTLSRDS